MSHDLIRQLGRQSRPRLMVLSLAMVLAIGCVNFLLGPVLSPSLLYLFPILLATWFLGRKSGLVMAAIAGVVWFAADMLAGHPHSHKFFPYWDLGLRLGFLLAIAGLFSVLRAEVGPGDEEQAGRTDGPAGHGYFYELISYEIERCRRYKHPFTLLYVEIDDFEALNASLGHGFGEALLDLVTRALKSNIRSADMVAKVGADQFAILLPETDDEGARAVTAKLQAALAEAVHEPEWVVTFGIGAVTYVKPPRTLDEMVRLADDLMYFVRKSGKNMIRHEVYNYSTSTLK